MKYSMKGALSTGTVVALSLVGVLVLVASSLAATYIGAFNYGVKAEADLGAVYEDSQNVLSQYSLKIAESAQIPAMYRDDLKEVYTAAIQGRYGENGSQATMQWLKEQNPNLDSAMYVTIQQQIEAGRNKFEVAQRLVIERKKLYEQNLGYFWRGMWLRVAGYPKMDLSKIVIVKSEHSNEAFSTGVDKGMTIRK